MLSGTDIVLNSHPIVVMHEVKWHYAVENTYGATAVGLSKFLLLKPSLSKV